MSLFFPLKDSKQAEPLCLHVSVHVAVAAMEKEEEKWIGPSAFRQQQGVSGTVRTAQTWLARWLDDKL